MAFSLNSFVRQAARIIADALVDAVAGSLKSGSSRSGSSSRADSRSSRRSGSSRPTPSRPSSRTVRDIDEGAAAGSPGRSIREVPVAEALAHAEYAPDPDGAADPGEVVWTWVPYQEDATQGKDRPVVVLGRANGGVYVVQLTSKDHDRDAEQEARWGRYWLDIGTGAWDPKGRPSEVRLDRALWVRTGEVRREGATLPRSTWETIVGALRDHA